jgi:hypothetical protein
VIGSRFLTGRSAQNLGRENDGGNTLARAPAFAPLVGEWEKEEVRAISQPPIVRSLYDRPCPSTIRHDHTRESQRVRIPQILPFEPLQEHFGGRGSPYEIWPLLAHR